MAASIWTLGAILRSTAWSPDANFQGPLRSLRRLHFYSGLRTPPLAGARMDPDHPARPGRGNTLGDQTRERLTLGLVRLRTSTTHRNSPAYAWVLRRSPESAHG